MSRRSFAEKRTGQLSRCDDGRPAARHTLASQFSSRNWLRRSPMLTASAWSSFFVTASSLPVNANYVTPDPTPPMRGSGSIPRLFAIAYDASPMIAAGPLSPMIPYSILPL